jgi:hypothetical protein
MSLSTGSKIAIIGAIGLPIAGYAYYQYAINAWSFNINSALIKGKNGNKVTIGVVFGFSSKIGISFTISNLNLAVYIQGINVGAINQQLPNIIIPGNGSVPVAIDATLDLDAIESVAETAAVSAVINFFTGGSNAQSVVIQGYVTAKVNLPLLSLFSVNVPVSAQYSLVY